MEINKFATLDSWETCVQYDWRFSCVVSSDDVLRSQPALARVFSGLLSIFNYFSNKILNSSLSSTIIQDIEAMCEAGQASIAYFYFDFRDTDKQSLHNLVPSLLSQLSASSDPRCDILSHLYLSHERDNKQPSDNTLVECLKQMFAVTLPDHRSRPVPAEDVTPQKREFTRSLVPLSDSDRQLSEFRTQLNKEIFEYSM